MCLIVLGWRARPGHPLVVAANRDEFHGRPAAPAGFWKDDKAILAGRDLQAMGTWMGVSRSGRFAAVTNYRGAHEPSAPHSRGSLVVGFLKGKGGPAEYMKGIDGASYSGFTLLACDGEELWWMSNRDGAPRRLEPGYHALGNLLLDSPDVQPAKARVAALPPAVEPLFSALSAARIVNGQYGTRCSTILLRSENHVTYAERSFGPAGAGGETRRFRFSI
jgi:uncharacterized protein with NRDE domain